MVKFNNFYIFLVFLVTLIQNTYSMELKKSSTQKKEIHPSIVHTLPHELQELIFHAKIQESDQNNNNLTALKADYSKFVNSPNLTYHLGQKNGIKRNEGYYIDYKKLKTTDIFDHMDYNATSCNYNSLRENLTYTNAIHFGMGATLYSGKKKYDGSKSIFVRTPKAFDYRQGVATPLIEEDDNDDITSFLFDGTNADNLFLVASTIETNDKKRKYQIALGEATDQQQSILHKFEWLNSPTTAIAIANYKQEGKIKYAYAYTNKDNKGDNTIVLMEYDQNKKRSHELATFYKIENPIKQLSFITSDIVLALDYKGNLRRCIISDDICKLITISGKDNSNISIDLFAVDPVNPCQLIIYAKNKFVFYDLKAKKSCQLPIKKNLENVKHLWFYNDRVAWVKNNSTKINIIDLQYRCKRTNPVFVSNVNGAIGDMQESEANKLLNMSQKEIKKYARDNKHVEALMKEILLNNISLQCNVARKDDNNIVDFIKNKIQNIYISKINEKKGLEEKKWLLYSDNLYSYFNPFSIYKIPFAYNRLNVIKDEGNSNIKITKTFQLSNFTKTLIGTFIAGIGYQAYKNGYFDSLLNKLWFAKS